MKDGGYVPEQSSFFVIRQVVKLCLECFSRHKKTNCVPFVDHFKVFKYYRLVYHPCRFNFTLQATAWTQQTCALTPRSLVARGSQQSQSLQKRQQRAPRAPWRMRALWVATASTSMPTASPAHLFLPASPPPCLMTDSPSHPTTLRYQETQLAFTLCQINITCK